MKMIMILAMALALAGCQTTGSTQSYAPVCDALIGPIKYNARKPGSEYHAGPKLAPQLAQRNAVGANLNCPAYK